MFGRKQRLQRLLEMRKLGQRIETLAREAQRISRVVDTAPRNSVAWKLAATELVQAAKTCLELAAGTEDPQLIEIAQSVAARVRNDCPAEAAALGL